MRVCRSGPGIPENVHRPVPSDRQVQVTVTVQVPRGHRQSLGHRICQGDAGYRVIGFQHIRIAIPDSNLRRSRLDHDQVLSPVPVQVHAFHDRNVERGGDPPQLREAFPGEPYDRPRSVIGDDLVASVPIHVADGGRVDLGDRKRLIVISVGQRVPALEVYGDRAVAVRWAGCKQDIIFAIPVHVRGEDAHRHSWHREIDGFRVG
ncbi:hypothetical protein DSECCO2_527860 [anaerobic digester metagenome]